MSELMKIEARSAALGNGLVVRRALPTRQRRMVGAWCFLDHAGPVDFAPGAGMHVRAHPHIGLQTFTWLIEGEVMHGDKRGRELGWPTANMSVEGLHLPRLGVYAVLVDILTGPHRGSLSGVASLGVRPMFGRNQPNLEVHLFDFDQPIYGEHLSVALVDYLRPEAKFDGLQALIDQMDRDSAQARAILSAP